MVSMPLVQEQDAVVLRGGGEIVFLVALLVPFTLVMLAIALPSDPIWLHVIGWVLFVGCGIPWFEVCGQVSEPNTAT